LNALFGHRPLPTGAYARRQITSIPHRGQHVRIGSKADTSQIQKLTETEAVKEIEAALAKGPRRGPKPAEEAANDEGAEEEAA
jgi:hypothetical protein